MSLRISHKHVRERSINLPLDLVYIGHLPKDLLLYNLWKSARCSPYFYHCKDKLPTLSLYEVREAIDFMLQDNRPIEITTFYGRFLYLDISNDLLDISIYDNFNGMGTAKNIIDKLKISELQRSILRYYIAF